MMAMLEALETILAAWIGFKVFMFALRLLHFAVLHLIVRLALLYQFLAERFSGSARCKSNHDGPKVIPGDQSTEHT
jgi:hypothetical protein